MPIFIILILVVLASSVAVGQNNKHAPIDDTEKHMFAILDLPDQKSRRKYLRNG